jgi:hypothetical protein
VSKHWYHGRTVKARDFSLAHIGRQEANDREGPGFYFTSDKTEAEGYAWPSGIVGTFELNPRKLASTTKKPQKDQVLRLMKGSPDFEQSLSNWDEDPRKAEAAALKAMLAEGNEWLVLRQVGIDFYRYFPEAWAKGMVGLGIDGAIVPDNGGLSTHMVIYNPASIKVVKWEDYKGKDLPETHADRILRVIHKIEGSQHA